MPEFTVYRRGAGRKGQPKKRGGTWVVEWTELDSRTGRSRRRERKIFRKGDKGPFTKQRAEELAAEIYAKHSASSPTPHSPTLTDLFTLAVDEPGRSRLPGGPSLLTRQNRRRTFDRFLEFATTYPVERSGKMVTFGSDGLAAELTTPMVDAYFAARAADAPEDRPLSPRTIQRERDTLRRAFSFGTSRYAALREWKIDNPATIYIPPRSHSEEQTEVRNKAYSPDEVERMIRFARDGWTKEVEGVRWEKYGERRQTSEVVKWDQEFRVSEYVSDLVLLLWEAFGLRPGDGFRLQWSDIDWDRHLIRATTKGRSRWTPMTRRAEEMLERRRRVAPGTTVFWTSTNNPIDGPNAERALEAVCKAAGVPYRRGFYGLRHGGACNALDRNLLSIHQVAEVMGHSDIRTTSIYAKAPVEDFTEEFRRRADQARESARDVS